MGMVTFIAHDGSSQTLDIPDGTSLMHAAILSGVPDILGECGGAQMCATCHVYVDAPWLALLPAMQAPEDGMLESATSERRTESRLSCQIVMSPALDGIVVRTPPTQT